MDHEFIDAEDCDCEEEHCPVCVGGLAVCKICNLAEGCLTTHCPGEPVNADDQEAIYKGYFDFRNGAWWPLPNPTNQTF